MLAQCMHLEKILSNMKFVALYLPYSRHTENAYLVTHTIVLHQKSIPIHDVCIQIPAAHEELRTKKKPAIPGYRFIHHFGTPLEDRRDHTRGKKSANASLSKMSSSSRHSDCELA